MKKIIITIGSILFTAVMYAVPVALACAFCLGWDSILIIFLMLAAMGQFAFLTFSVIDAVSEEE